MEVYEKILIFIPIDITKDVVRLVVRKLLGSSYTGITNSEDPHGWLIKFGEAIKNFVLAMEFLLDG